MGSILALYGSHIGIWVVYIGSMWAHWRGYHFVDLPSTCTTVCLACTHEFLNYSTGNSAAVIASLIMRMMPLGVLTTDFLSQSICPSVLIGDLCINGY